MIDVAPQRRSILNRKHRGQPSGLLQAGDLRHRCGRSQDGVVGGRQPVKRIEQFHDPLEPMPSVFGMHKQRKALHIDPALTQTGQVGVPGGRAHGDVPLGRRLQQDIVVQIHNGRLLVHHSGDGWTRETRGHQRRGAGAGQAGGSPRPNRRDDVAVCLRRARRFERGSGAHPQGV